ncbi:MAG: OmpA family protein [Paracoccaceae bacterium]
MTMRITVLAAIAGSFLVGACTPDPYDPADPNRNTKNSAIAGAAVGAILGASTAKNGKHTMDRAIGGAILGGVAGGMIGSSLDAQAKELAQEVDSRIQIINEGNQLRVVMPEGILFASDSDAVQQGIMNDLYTVADSLNRYPNTRVEVIGHTDSTGSAAYNQDLSQRRAQAVSRILVGAGVSGGRVVPYGRGEDMPVATNMTDAGKAQNRRVEILIIPTG